MSAAMPAVDPAPHPAALERPPNAFRLREPVPDGVQRCGVHAEPDMTRMHLDVLGHRPFGLDAAISSPRIRRDEWRTPPLGESC